MKRLKLEEFKAKNCNKEDAQRVDQLLGQILGDCHDGDNNLEDTEGQIIKSTYN